MEMRKAPYLKLFLNFLGEQFLIIYVVAVYKCLNLVIFLLLKLHQYSQPLFACLLLNLKYLFNILFYEGVDLCDQVYLLLGNNVIIFHLLHNLQLLYLDQ